LAYRVVYKKSVHRDLKKLPREEIRRILDKIERALLRDPMSNPPLKGPFAGLRRLRIGDFRVIYAILNEDILILRIGHRKDVYKSET
jgi:mRNA interferase RelE/StbE